MSSNERDGFQVSRLLFRATAISSTIDIGVPRACLLFVDTNVSSEQVAEVFKNFFTRSMQPSLSLLSLSPQSPRKTGENSACHRLQINNKNLLLLLLLLLLHFPSVSPSPPATKTQSTILIQETHRLSTRAHGPLRNLPHLRLRPNQLHRLSRPKPHL